MEKGKEMENDGLMRLVNKMKLSAGIGLLIGVICFFYFFLKQNNWECTLLVFGLLVSQNIGWIIGCGLACIKGRQSFNAIYLFANYSASLGTIPIWLLLHLIVPAPQSGANYGPPLWIPAILAWGVFPLITILILVTQLQFKKQEGKD